MKQPRESRIESIIKELYQKVEELESLYHGRKFTLDGHIIGSIGEVLAAEKYNLELLPASAKTHDAKDKEGKYFQIKTTQGSSIALSSEPDFIIIQKLIKTGEIIEIYKGPGKIVWGNCGPFQKNGQKRISLNKLLKIFDNKL